jgi:hypothetical protein
LFSRDSDDLYYSNIRVLGDIITTSKIYPVENSVSLRWETEEINGVAQTTAEMERNSKFSFKYILLQYVNYKIINKIDCFLQFHLQN